MISKTGIQALFLVALAVTALSSRAALAIGPALSVLGGIDQVTNTGGSTGYTAGARLGLGLGMLDADVSAMFLSRAFSGLDNFNFIHVPVMVRYSFVPMLSVGAGGYYDAAITSGASAVYGLRGGLQFKPIGLPLFLEGAYLYNLGKGDAGSLNDLQVLVGFQL